GDREIESRSLLAQLRGGEIHCKAPVRPVQLGRGDTATDTLLRLLAGAVGQADDRERRQPVLEVRLDLDAPCVETDERMGDRPCEHAADASGEVVTCPSRLRAGIAKTTDENVFEVLRCPSPRPSVHVPPVPPLLAQARALQDLWIELAP